MIHAIVQSATAVPARLAASRGRGRAVGGCRSSPPCGGKGAAATVSDPCPWRLGAVMDVSRTCRSAEAILNRRGEGVVFTSTKPWRVFGMIFGWMIVRQARPGAGCSGRDVRLPSWAFLISPRVQPRAIREVSDLSDDRGKPQINRHSRIVVEHYCDCLRDLLLAPKGSAGSVRPMTSFSYYSACLALVLAGKPITSKDVLSIVGGSTANVREYLEALTDRGYLVRRNELPPIGRGKPRPVYRLDNNELERSLVYLARTGGSFDFGSIETDRAPVTI